MPNRPQKRKRASARDQIVELIDLMPEHMQIKLLRFLELKLPKRIKKNLVIEKRADFRRHCLISVDYVVKKRSYQSFILDISAFGVFIESDGAFSVGDDIMLKLSLPRYSDMFNIQGEIVWSGAQGFGVKFKSLNRRQMKIIKSFSEEESGVYNIVS